MTDRHWHYGSTDGTSAVAELPDHPLHLHHSTNTGHVESLIADLLYTLGEDPQREGLLKTPDRVARMYQELLAGYHEDPATIINNALFEVDSEDMVIVRDVEFYSLCEHHMLPFWGHAHIAYIPDGKVIGLSKIPRIVDLFSRRLQLQERLTRQVADCLHDALRPRGLAVLMQGQHLCSMMRGVRKQDSQMMTSVFLGSFQSDAAVSQRFLVQLGVPKAIG